MTKETFTFQAEVGKILDIVAHSLYSEKEVFLRELISNASDACDKLRYAAISDSSLSNNNSDFKIEIEANKKEKTLILNDNGIGMSKEELIESLGTIAKSGTQAFMESLKNKDDKEVQSSLIGLFGVGFNIATSKLGDITTIYTKQVTSPNWYSASLNIRELIRKKSYLYECNEVELKGLSSVSGTIIEIQLNHQLL